jgi:hypothetical protein
MPEFIFRDEFDKHKSIVNTPHSPRFPRLFSDEEDQRRLKTFFNSDLHFGTGISLLPAIKSRITAKNVLQENDPDARALLLFLSGLYAESHSFYKGWIYVDATVKTGEVTLFWDEQQRQWIAEAYVHAIWAVTTAINALMNPEPATHDLFIKWFGNSHNAIDTHHAMTRMADQYKRMFRNLNNGTPRIAADDVAYHNDSSTFALVALNEKMNVVYIGKGFWERDLIDITIERQQTFIHEWSHKFFDPRTDDVTNTRGLNIYGVKACLSMLKTMPPEDARKNADNVGYFALDVWLAKYRGLTYKGNGYLKPSMPYRKATPHPKTSRQATP